MSKSKTPAKPSRPKKFTCTITIKDIGKGKFSFVQNWTPSLKADTMSSETPALHLGMVALRAVVTEIQALKERQ